MSIPPPGVKLSSPSRASVFDHGHKTLMAFASIFSHAWLILTPRNLGYNSPECDLLTAHSFISGRWGAQLFTTYRDLWRVCTGLGVLGQDSTKVLRFAFIHIHTILSVIGHKFNIAVILLHRFIHHIKRSVFEAPIRHACALKLEVISSSNYLYILRFVFTFAAFIFLDVA